MSIDLSCLNIGGKSMRLRVANGLITEMTPVIGPATAVAMPLPVDPHLHLDKTFTISRCGDIEPGLFGAIDANRADAVNWTEADVHARATRGIREAYSNGINALRSHVDWVEPDAPIAWSVLGDIATDWAGKLTVQRAALAPLDLLSDETHGPRIARHVAQSGGILGCFVYCNADLDAKVETVFRLAAQHDLALDFHVDEGLSPDARGFDAIVAMTAKYAISGRVLCGHACSLSIRPAAEAARAMENAAKAGVALTVLPTTNLHLQDMQPGRSPRLRGLAPMQELREAGVRVVLGADNVADPFYPRGCFDAVETLRIACLAGHLDPADWINAISTDAATVMGVPTGAITVGARADFLMIEGSDWGDALRDPRRTRHVIRAGQNQMTGKTAA
ncbi:amidohydrolase family protein [Albirhodobacter sp. R86504]|uniref:amidohydrolase family protein n=1 Tax=Albirhodobacter sp. R86504 TaxID=3093848 RepID=UPI00366EAF6F